MATTAVIDAELRVGVLASMQLLGSLTDEDLGTVGKPRLSRTNNLTE